MPLSAKGDWDLDWDGDSWGKARRPILYPDPVAGAAPWGGEVRGPCHTYSSSRESTVRECRFHPLTVTRVPTGGPQAQPTTRSVSSRVWVRNPYEVMAPRAKYACHTINTRAL